VFPGERFGIIVEGIDEMVFGIIYKILCFVLRKYFDVGKGMPILKRKLDLSNFLNLAKEFLLANVSHIRASCDFSWPDL